MKGTDLRRLEFTLTERCNSECSYCQASAGPRLTGVMEVADGYAYLDAAVKVAKLESFLVFGGEPMLYPARAVAFFERAHSLKIPTLEMLTNGTWGRNKKRAETLAKKLKQAGLNSLGISVDAFHLEHIPLEFPRRAAEASVKAGVEKVVWNVAVLESLTADNRYDSVTARILKDLEPVGIEAHVHRVAAAGRALEKIPQFFPKTPLEGPCEGETPMENALINPKCLTIEPSGLVEVCWHLYIGNAKETPLDRIICEYDWRKNPLIKLLVEEGPMGLLKEAKLVVGGFRRDLYVNKCHLCVELRRRLDR